MGSPCQPGQPGVVVDNMAACVPALCPLPSIGVLPDCHTVEVCSDGYATTDGTNYTAYATNPILLGSRNGNMVHDASRDAVWQLQALGFPLQDGVDGLLRGTMQLLRIEPGLTQAIDTQLPAPYGLPWLAMDNGTLWTTTEAAAADGSIPPLNIGTSHRNFLLFHSILVHRCLNSRRARIQFGAFGAASHLPVRDHRRPSR